MDLYQLLNYAQRPAEIEEMFKACQHVFPFIKEWIDQAISILETTHILIEIVHPEQGYGIVRVTLCIESQITFCIGFAKDQKIEWSAMTGEIYAGTGQVQLFLETYEYINKETFDQLIEKMKSVKNQFSIN